MSVKLSDLTQVKSFEPVRSLSQFGLESVLGHFIATQEGAEIIESVFESITGERLPETEKRRQSALSVAQIRRSHLVRANFGTGKTITLLALTEMLAALGSPDLYRQWREQFHRFPTVQTQYDRVHELSGGRPFLCLTVDMKEKGSVPFRDVVVQALQKWLQANRPDTVLNSEFASATEQLDSALSRMPDPLRNALDHRAPGLTLAELRQGLLEWDRSSLELAYQIMEEAAGFPPDRARVEMRDYYGDARSRLAGEFAGVVVVLDELHHFFTTSASFNNLSVSLADFDAFAVYINETKSGPIMPCVMVGAIHENLGSYLKGSGYSQDAFQQAVGRFEEHPLTSALSQAELIAGAFLQIPGRLPALLNQNASVNASARLVGLRSSTGDSWMQCFPLHPAVVTYLPLLARRLAQNDRTTFHFIGGEVRHWVSEQDAVVEGRLSLVLLPQVWTYFAKAIEEWEPALIQAINNAVSYCGGQILHRQIMETLACLQVASSVTTTNASHQLRSGLTRDMIANFLNFPERTTLDAALQDLTASGYLHLSDGDEYFLVASGGLSHVELNRRIDQLTGTIDADAYLIDTLTNDWTLRGKTVLQPMHTQKSCVNRSFKVSIVTLEGLKAFAEPPGRGFSGSFLFVIPPLAWDAAKLEQEIRGELARLHSLGGVVALPKRWDEISPDSIRRLQALRKLVGSGLSEEQKRTVSEKLVTEEAQVKERLTEFGQPGNWVFHTAFGPLQSKRKSLTEVLDAVVANLYPKFPEFKASNLQSPALIHSLLDRFLPNPKNLRCDVTTKGRVDSILSPIGLAESAASDPDSFSLCAPSDPNAHPKSLAVWQELESLDLSAKKPLELLYQRLMAPPYGLLPHMVEMYLGIFIRVRGVAVFSLKKNQYVTNLQTGVLQELSQYRDQFFVLEPPAHTPAETLRQLADIWAAVARATGSQAYLSAADPAVPDGAKRSDLVRDVRAWSDLVSTRLLTPLHDLEQADESAEILVHALSTAVQSLDVSPVETFQLVIAAGNPDRVEQVGQLAVAAGTDLSTLAHQWRSFLAVPAPDSEHYPELAAAHARLAALQGAMDLSSSDSIRDTLHSVDVFRLLFLAHYAPEHDELQQARAGFGSRVLKSPLFSLHRALGKVKVPAAGPKFISAVGIEAEILTEQKATCKVSGSSAMVHHGGFGCGQCPDGGYRLGTVNELARDLDGRATLLQEELLQATGEWLHWLNQLEEPSYVETLSLPATLSKYLYQHDKAAAGALSLLKLSLQVTLDDPERAVDALEHLDSVVGPLNGYLLQACGGVTGRKRVRRTLHDVVTLAEAVLAAQGKDVITLEPGSASPERQAILKAIEYALSAEDDAILEIVLRRKIVG